MFDANLLKHLFIDLAETITNNQQQLIVQLCSQNVVGAEPTLNIATFEKFYSKKGKFSCYLERFGNYKAVKTVTTHEKSNDIGCFNRIHILQ